VILDRARRFNPSRPHQPALRNIGSEPDPRFTFANERTFLAWNRTALALIATGLAVVQFLHLSSRGLQLIIALPLILLGGVAAATSYTRWEQSERALRLGRPLPDSTFTRPLAYGVAAVAAAATLVVIIDITALK
jgi:putative membrane protein